MWLKQFTEHPTIVEARNISPYLVEGDDAFVVSRGSPICDVPVLCFGNKATDGGNLILSQQDRDELIAREPGAASFVRTYLSAEDFLNGQPRFCIWLEGRSPQEWRRIRGIATRVNGVRAFREASRKAKTREDANIPSVFAEIRQPRRRFLAIPKTSSERRTYIPIAFLGDETIVASELYFCEGANNYHFGLLTSAMHMAWVRQVCGRLKSDYRYSNKLVYNNFPWPQDVNDAKRTSVEEAAREVLDARAAHPEAALADLYDPLSMPADLSRAHVKLDRAVDRCYRSQPFTSERNRVEFLFNLYQGLTAPLLQAPKRRRRKAAD